jgi:hypothetical protein
MPAPGWSYRSEGAASAAIRDGWPSSKGKASTAAARVSDSQEVDHFRRYIAEVYWPRRRSLMTPPETPEKTAGFDCQAQAGGNPSRVLTVQILRSSAIPRVRTCYPLAER